MSGAGNDFILIDKSLNPEIVLSNDLIMRFCDRRKGIGADGIILIENTDKYDFSMEYYNSDGSTTTLCGNGARCAIRYAKRSGRVTGKTAQFLSNGIEYKGELLNNGLVTFNLNQPQNLRENFLIESFGYKIPASFVDTGSPHVVINVGELDSTFTDKMEITSGLVNFPVVKIGKEIRNNKKLAPVGSNVNFVEIIKDSIHIRTYERGVENETLACGTGAVASAIIGSIKYKINPPVSIVTEGGDILKVDFEINGPDIINVSLTGPALEIFSGEISIN